MLSRTANQLFWMGRYGERAANTARMLDVNVQTSLLPQSSEAASTGWRALLGLSELNAQYDSRHATIDSPAVLEFMIQDPENRSSIYSCLQAARENARAVRGVITTEVWETYNSTWLMFRQRVADPAFKDDPAKLLEWVKYRLDLSSGVMASTMLRDEALHFTQLGATLERADNTARILDVKYHELAQMGLLAEGEASVIDDLREHDDFYYWAAVLRSVAAFETYLRVFRDVITPQRVAELMILRHDMPRSLVSCLEQVLATLRLVGNDRSDETERRAALLHAELRFGRIEDILERGLHAFLTDFLARINDLAARISQEFLENQR